MLVYRICQTKYAHNLTASGIDARWNMLHQKMIYTAGSIALACLENLAHKSGTSLSSGKFSIASIDVANDVKIEEVKLKDLISLNKEWYLTDHYPITQTLGSSWLNNNRSAVLKVPSAIIDLEYNYLFNPNHHDFSKMKIVNIDKFNFDTRLKSAF